MKAILHSVLSSIDIGTEKNHIMNICHEMLQKSADMQNICSFHSGIINNKQTTCKMNNNRHYTFYWILPSRSSAACV